MKIPRFEKELQKVAEKLLLNGKKAYLVGGAVRDIFLARTITDFDIATDATPEQCMQLFPYAIPTGIKHGTITVIPHSRRFKIEITTFRLESSYSDGRHPDRVDFIDDIIQDLARRDFTINAMAINLASNEFIDPFDGEYDLKNKIIRAVGEPTARFDEDALRAIRAVRFAAQLGFEIETSTLDAARNYSHALKRLSTERIRDEFSKLLLAIKPSTGLKLLIDTKMIDAIVPELMACIGVPQPLHGAQDVLSHLLATTDAITAGEFSDEKALILRLSALFHDVGKPQCFSLQNGSISFYMHEVESEKIARNRLTQLKYPNSIIDEVCHLVLHHMFNYEPAWTDSAVRRFIARVGIRFIPDLFELRLADTIATTGAPISWPLLSEFKSRIDLIIENKQAFTVKDLKVRGDDLARIGIPRSREMGAMLDYLLEAVLDDPTLNTKESLINLAKNKYFNNR